MPTTPEEAKKLVEIALDYFEDPAELVSFTKRLWWEIGLHTDNESLAITLRMLHELCLGFIQPKEDACNENKESGCASGC